MYINLNRKVPFKESYFCVVMLLSHTFYSYVMYISDAKYISNVILLGTEKFIPNVYRLVVCMCYASAYVYYAIKQFEIVFLNKKRNCFFFRVWLFCYAVCLICFACLCLAGRAGGQIVPDTFKLICIQLNLKVMNNYRNSIWLN